MSTTTEPTAPVLSDVARTGNMNITVRKMPSPPACRVVLIQFPIAGVRMREGGLVEIARNLIAEHDGTPIRTAGFDYPISLAKVVTNDEPGRTDFVVSLFPNK